MSSRISVDPAALADAATMAVGIADGLHATAADVKGVSLAGCSPRSEARVRATLATASRLVQQAAQAAAKQSRAMDAKLQAALRYDAVDALGDLGKDFTKITPFDAGGLADAARTTYRETVVKRLADEQLAANKKKWAKKLYERDPWRRHLWPSPEAMRQALRQGKLAELRKLEKKTRVLSTPERLARIDPRTERPSLYRKPALTPGRAAKGLARKVPVIGAPITMAGNLHEKDDQGRRRSVADAAAKTTAQSVAAAAGATAGVAGCGAGMALTGPGVALSPLVCPAVGIAVGAVADKVVGAAYDPIKKLVTGHKDPPPIRPVIGRSVQEAIKALPEPGGRRAAPAL